MTIENARHLAPLWAAETELVKVYEPPKGRSTPEKAKPQKPRKRARAEEFKKRYGILLVLALAFTLYTVILSASVEARTEKRVWSEAKAKYEADLAEYKETQAYEAQKEHWLSGDASKEAFINQEITAGAKAISKEANDQVKGTKLGVGLARMINKYYPGTLKEVFAQPDQFMFISEDNTYTQHDWDLAESIIRPYYEDGIIPQGLTENMVYFEWSGTTATARDSYQTTTGMSTWRYQG